MQQKFGYPRDVLLHSDVIPRVPVTVLRLVIF